MRDARVLGKRPRSKKKLHSTGKKCKTVFHTHKLKGKRGELAKMFNTRLKKFINQVLIPHNVIVGDESSEAAR